MTGTPHSVVLLGAVRHAEMYQDLLARLPGVRVRGVFEAAEAPARFRDLADGFASRNGVERFDNIDLAVAAADVLFVCTEPVRHAGMALLGLERGAATIIDKPASTSLRDMERILEVTERTSVACGVITRSVGDQVRRARDWVDAGHIGFPRSVQVEFLANGARVASAVESLDLVINPEFSGGGELMNFLSYAVDNIRYLTGCEPIEVFAEGGALFSTDHEAAGVEDSGVLSIAFTNGLIASVVIGRVAFAPASGAVASTLMLVGSHGHVLIQEERPAVFQFGAGGIEMLPALGDPNVRAVANYVVEAFDAIAVGAPLPYDIRDAAVAVAVTIAAYESIATGQPAEVRRFASSARA